MEPDWETYSKDRGEPDVAARWMTFAELASVRRTSKRAAVTLVRRHGWRRQRNNEGHVIALVPLTWADQAEAEGVPGEPHVDTPRGPHGEAHNTAFETALAAIEAAHASEVASLRAQVDTSEQARIAMQTLADRSLAQLADTTAEATTLREAIEGLRAKIGRAEDERDRARGDAQAAQDAAAELRLAAEARKARGRLRRAWDGWRGR
jgi:hypothetical protein